MNKCKLCEEEYNYILPDGYCGGCRKALDAQHRKIASQMIQTGSTQTTQENSLEIKVFN